MSTNNEESWLVRTFFFCLGVLVLAFFSAVVTMVWRAALGIR